MEYVFGITGFIGFYRRYLGHPLDSQEPGHTGRQGFVVPLGSGVAHFRIHHLVFCGSPKVSEKENFVPHWEINQWVGNCKTNKVGTIASGVFKGGSGDFKGYLVVVEDNRYEIWDESTLVLIPRDPEKPAPLAAVQAGVQENKV
jgi:hypothetical protein